MGAITVILSRVACGEGSLLPSQKILRKQKRFAQDDTGLRNKTLSSCVFCGIYDQIVVGTIGSTEMMDQSRSALILNILNEKRKQLFIGLYRMMLNFAS